MTGYLVPVTPQYHGSWVVGAILSHKGRPSCDGRTLDHLNMLPYMACARSAARRLLRTGYLANAKDPLTSRLLCGALTPTPHPALCSPNGSSTDRTRGRE